MSSSTFASAEAESPFQLADARPAASEALADEVEGPFELSEASRAIPGPTAGYLRWLQGALNRVLGTALTVDGRGGPATRSAVTQFQRRHGLHPDGNVGPLTEARLAAVSGVPAPTGPGGPVTAPTASADVIRGWNQHGAEVSRLPREEQEKLMNMARRVVDSFTTPGRVPLGRIVVVGHADQDPQGPAFELKVSRERALSIAAALSAAIIKEFRSRGIVRIRPGAIAFQPSPEGIGATRPDPEARRDRTLNRRVEVQLFPRGEPVPPPPPADDLPTRARRALKILQTRGFKIDSTGRRRSRARCLLTKMLRPDVVDVFVDGTQRDRKIGDQRVPGFTASFPGRYDGSPKAAHPGPPLPDSEFVKLLGTVSALLKSAGWAPGVPDDLILEFLDAVVLEKIYGGILRVEKYLATQVNGFTGQYEGDRARIRCNSVYSDHLDDENNIYHCWKDYRGGEDAQI